MRRETAALMVLSECDEDVHCSTNQQKVNQLTGQKCERDFFGLKEGRENETQFCCVLMLCVTRDGYCAEIGKNAIRPAFDGIIFPLLSFHEMFVDSSQLHNCDLRGEAYA